MDNSISPDLEKRMHELCDDIASAEALSPELHEELYTHIEDKMLGYLSGEETLSEADAFLLAREHFGDRLEIRTQLEEIQPVDTPINFWKYFAIAIVVSIGLSIPFQLFKTTQILFFQQLNSGAMYNAVFFMVYFTVFMVIQCKILYSWKQRELVGKTNWYHRWSLGKLFVLIVTLSMFSVFINISGGVLLYSFLDSSQIYPQHSDIGASDRYAQLLTLATVYGSIAGMLLTWFMWFKGPRKVYRHAFNVTGAFLLYNLMSSVLYSLVLVRPMALPEPTDITVELVPNIQWVLLSAENFVIGLNIQFYWLFIPSLLMTSFPALITWLAYCLWHKFRPQRSIGKDILVVK